MKRRITADPVLRDRDGLAIIGRTRHDLTGIRYEGDESGNTPPAGSDPTPPPGRRPHALSH